MAQIWHHEIPAAAYPRYYFFQKRLDSIYPRLRKAAGKKQWRTVGMSSQTTEAEEKLLAGPLRPEGEFQLSAIGDIQQLAKIASTVNTLNGQKPEVFVVGSSLSTESLVQSTKFPDNEEISTNEILSITSKLSPEETKPLVIICVVDWTENKPTDSTIVESTLQRLEEAIPKSTSVIDNLFVFVKTNGSDEEMLQSEVTKWMTESFRVTDSDKKIIINSGLEMEIGKHFERKVIRGMELVMEYLSSFPSGTRTKLADDLLFEKGQVVEHLVDSLEAMVANLKDIWESASGGRPVPDKVDETLGPVQTELSRRFMTFLLQKLSQNEGGCKQMIVDAAVLAIMKRDAVFRATSSSDLLWKLKEIIQYQLYKGHPQGTKAVIRRREYRVFATVALQHIDIDLLLEKVLGALNVADSAMLELHKLRFEVHGLLRQTLAKADHPVYKQPFTRATAESIKKIKGVYGCGLVYGRLVVHLYSPNQSLWDYSARELVSNLLASKKVFRNDFSFEYIACLPQPLAGACAVNAVGTKLVSPALNITGTLGCFALDMISEKRMCLTCAHCVCKNTSTMVQYNGVMKQLGTTICSMPVSETKSAIDIAAVEIEKEQWTNCWLKFPVEPNTTGMDRFGKLFTADLESSDIRTVFKNGANSNFTTGLLAGEKYYVGDELEHTVLIAGTEDDPFALAGDSGSVVYAIDLDSTDNVHLIAMVHAGEMKSRSLNFSDVKQKGSKHASEEEEKAASTLAHKCRMDEDESSRKSAEKQAEQPINTQTETAKDNVTSNPPPKRPADEAESYRSRPPKQGRQSDDVEAETTQYNAEMIKDTSRDIEMLPSTTSRDLGLTVSPGERKERMAIQTVSLGERKETLGIQSLTADGDSGPTISSGEGISKLEIQTSELLYERREYTSKETVPPELRDEDKLPSKKTIPSELEDEDQFKEAISDADNIVRDKCTLAFVLREGVELLKCHGMDLNLDLANAAW